MKDFGRMIKQMATAHLLTQVMQSMMENGSMICNMDMEKKLGKMEKLYMKEVSLRARKTVKAFSSGKTEAFTKEIS